MSVRSHLKVLTLEDNAFQRQVLVAALRSLGIRDIVEVEDGEAGLAAIRQAVSAFDLIVCDLGMQGMDGLEFLKHTESHDVGGLIICSGQDESVLSSAEWMARAYNAPVLGVMRKPLDKAILASLVDKLDASRTIMSDVFGRRTEDADAEDAAEAIRSGLELGAFVPFYQPKIALATGELIGVEVLARWQHPVRGTLSPIHFIDLMERFDLIDLLTHSMLEQACAAARTWAAAGIEVGFALNVSPTTLERPGCAGRLLAKMTSAGTMPESVTIEITEQAFSTDPREMLESVLRLRVHGCRISVDDYGVGYSSLQQISRTPVTELKLDRSFIKHLQDGSKALSIVESTIALAKKLNLKTVAEGIESVEQADCLRRLGCDVGQGYLFARPMESETFVAWHRGREAGRRSPQQLASRVQEDAVQR